MAVFLFGPPSRGTPVTALFRVWQHATGGGHTVRVAMGRRRGSVSNREGTIAVVEPPAPRQQEHLRPLEFFAIVRLARAAPSRCSLGRMHNGEIFSTAPKRDTGHRQRNRGLLSLQAFRHARRRACETTYSIRDLLGWRAHCLCRDGPRNASRAGVSLVDPFGIRAR